MENLPPSVLAALLVASGGLNLTVLAYIGRRVTSSLDSHGEKVDALANRVTVIHTHLFGATGDNGMNSRVRGLETRADDAEQWQHDHKSLHQAVEVRLALVEERAGTTRRRAA